MCHFYDVLNYLLTLGNFVVAPRKTTPKTNKVDGSSGKDKSADDTAKTDAQTESEETTKIEDSDKTKIEDSDKTESEDKRDKKTDEKSKKPVKK